jgi:site-specific DNA-cytosine methylase
MRPRPKTKEIFLLEDNATTAERRSLPGVGTGNVASTVTIRIHKLSAERNAIVARATYEAGSMRSKNGARIELVGSLIRRAVACSVEPVVIAGTSYGSAASFLAMLSNEALPFVVQIRPSTPVTLAEKGQPIMAASETFSRATWKQITAAMPDGTRMPCSAAKLAKVVVPGCAVQLFAAQIGRIDGLHRGTIIGLSSFDGSLTDLVALAAHSKWIRREIRGKKRASASRPTVERLGIASTITARANITLARRQDERGDAMCAAAHIARRTLKNAAAVLNVVELFSGAGGMGLGFLLGGGSERRYQIVFSGEATPIFAQTLRINHQEYERAIGRNAGARTPSELATVELREKKVLECAAAAARDSGGAHFLIGGPPCQGFSMANRNSWSADNPKNELVDVFVRYILKLRPLGFLMENVQGILWTADTSSTVSVVDAIARQLKAAGYVLFPKLLDAAWYGVPQNRTRNGAASGPGVHARRFWGMGTISSTDARFQRRPFVTVRQAIADLPRIGNGHLADQNKYLEASNESSTTSSCDTRDTEQRPTRFRIT